MCRTKLLHTVTFLTSILIRPSGELSFVHVLMTGNALRLLDLEESVLAFGNMALLAFHFGMAAFKWILTRGVFHDTEG